ncbi:MULTISPECIES: glycoside hydrolase family 127 protein [unclassified Sphingomonas]|uniref:glycoside hydrolase family 127 protein n=1 Tax=unclassified Sphingomonas TaxID=196159 RepID=UPI002269A492|nr:MULTISPECIES: glycoside hydrolase family 127 protein [unclassified Sphingomonas]
MRATRRELMWGMAAVTLVPAQGIARARGAGLLPASAKPLPLTAVRLRPSAYATAVEVNRAYLLRLSADRLLHNFMVYAGLPAKAPLYGGWESDTIAGHTLGHYLTALVKMNEQTGDAECRTRADYIVSELARAQAKRGTGYVGALGRKRKDGTVVDGEEIFPEVMKGEIKSGGFDLNGSWSPLYTVHKTFAGLLDVHEAWGNTQALAVATGLGDYFARVFAALSDEQMEKLLSCEYGGLNESFAELYARTGDRKWLAVAERVYDHRVLDPLVAGQDKLANFHANTQVPKLIGLARIHELNGRPEPANAARFFWTTVTQHHSYVIGGNADREYFSEPDTIATHITEQTCEHCNSYNMLKLTQHLYSWKPEGALFDYYERTHLNHVMAAQNPKNAGFTYMTPLMTGADRGYSTPDDDAFWCCVGTGMESHAKHGEAIFWEGDGTLLVNLYIPAEAQWKARGADLTLDTRYPFEPESRLTLTGLSKPGRFAIALRVPGWAGGLAVVTVNGQAVTPAMEGGYAIVERRWKKGDSVAITLPLELRIESAPGDPNTIAFLRGPMVMAADLGPNETKWDSADPAMVGEDLLGRFTPTDPARATYATQGIIRPADLSFVPFYSQYDRRSAVYFKRFTEAAWKSEEAAFTAEQANARDIAARSVDVMHLGEMQPERDHNLTSEISYPVSYRGRNGRDARSGGFFEFAMKTKPGQLVLQATYWGDERGRDFDILVDNVKIATQHLEADKPGKFFDVEYPLPLALTKGKASVKIRFVPRDRSSAGPVFGVRLFTAKPGSIA